MRTKSKEWSKSIKEEIKTFSLDDLGEHAFLYHSNMSNESLIRRILDDNKKNATTFDISMEEVAKYIRESLSDDREREMFLHAILYNEKKGRKVYHDIWTDKIIGHGYRKCPAHDWKTGPRNCTDIGIYAVRDITSRFGFRILSVYPIFSPDEFR